MTRELKLALIVGFALILFVGILISDHFSTARLQQSADLTHPEDPLDTSRWENPELLALNTRETEAAQAERPSIIESAHLNAQKQLPEDPVRTIMMGESAGQFIEIRPQTTTASLDVFHDVRSGESLTAICRTYYGDGSLVEKLARYNGIDDPDLVESGRRLRIPAAAQLGGTSSPSLPRHNQPPAPLPTYTVREGDTLSEIASQLLGSARKYGEIFEVNRDQLRSPNDVRAGMVLKIPRSQ